MELTDVTASSYEIEKDRGIDTLSTILLFPQCYAIRSENRKIVKFVKIMALIFEL